MIVITVIAILAGLVTITVSALEKYHRNSGEYPSVAAMTSSNVDTLKAKLGVSDAGIFRFPTASANVTNFLATSNPSHMYPYLRWHLPGRCP